MKARLAVATAALIAASIPYPALAQDDDDGPGRGVARISLINGDVSVRRGDTGEFVAAAINSPVVVQDRVVTGVNSRAEVQLDYSNYIRLAGEAEIRLSELEYRRYQVQVARGLVTVNVLRDSDADIEIATPAISIRPNKRGIYRIVVRPDDTTEVTVRKGEVEVFTPQGSERLKSGRTMLARGSQDNPEVQVLSANREDAWDDWNENRNKDLERAQSNSYQYVSRDVYGAEDLYGHGDWIDSPPYGRVWAPRVAVGWAPYRYGRWAWVDWYGWTWVSYDTWGWAPYHYGRWFYAGNRWCWWPGGGGRHYWRPGLVAFVGWGGGGIGIGFGRVGWIPLAPYERYNAWYGNRYYGGFRNRTYIDNSVTIVNNVNIHNTYRNSRVNNGITGINGSDFGRGRGRFESFNGRDIGQASLVRGQVPYAPDRDSLRFSDRDSRITRSNSDNERFYARRTPAAVDRVSFDDQRRGMEQVNQRTFGNSGDRSTRGGESVAGGGGRQADPGRRAEVGRQAEGGRQAEAGRPSDSFVRGGESGNRSSGPDAGGRGAAPSDSSNSGWRRFGDSTGRSAEAVRGSGGAESRGAPDAGRSSEGFSRRNESNSSGDSNGWRRLGAGADRSSGDRSVEGRSSAGNSSGGRSFEDSGSRSSDIGTRGSGSSDRSSDSNGWRRFGDPGSSQSERGTDRGSRIDRSSEGSSSRGSDSFGGRGTMDRGSSRSESPRISPPIVRERSNDGSGSRSGGDFGGRSSGRSEQRSEPRYVPRSSGGDYGGGRSGGGPSFGGGGGRSSGGGPSFGGGGGRSSGGGPSFGGGGGRSSGGGGEGRGSGGGGGRSSGGGGGRGGRNQ